MKFVPSFAFEDLSGSAKGVTAAKSRGRRYLRSKGYGSSANTASQSSVKVVFKSLAQSWKNLTNAQINAWNNLAQSQSGRSVLGSTAKITGANLYMRLNYWIVSCGGTALQNPPVLKGVEAPARASFLLNPEAIDFELNSLPTVDAAELRLVIQASAPQSNGISNAYKKATTIGLPRVATTASHDIMDDYLVKFGTPTLSSPKVFFKWFFVNITTGEVSGSQMACVKYTNDSSQENEVIY